jgi:hypothetical protein
MSSPPRRPALPHAAAEAADSYVLTREAAIVAIAKKLPEGKLRSERIGTRI